MEGYINGYRVVYDNPYALWDKDYLSATYSGVRKCLEPLPRDIKFEEVVKGMMVLTKGRINPQIIKEVWNEFSKE